MRITFDNDGTYGQGALLRPVLVEDYPIGFISEVSRNTVACEIFDQCVQQVMAGLNMTTDEQDVRALSFCRYRR